MMKAIIIILGVGLGTLLGYFPSHVKPKPLWWKALLFFLMIAVLGFSLIPPIAGNFSDAYFIGKLGSEKAINVKFSTKNLSTKYDESSTKWVIIDNSIKGSLPNTILVNQKTLPVEFNSGKELIIKTNYDQNQNAYIYFSTEYVNPLITLPYVPDLEERIRILNFHVPMSWIGVLAYLISMIYSIMYLKTRNNVYEIYASSAAGLGTVFTILATVTGMIWAKFNWGSFWNWDPRETSIFVLLLIYFAYFALRSAIENQELKSRLSSVYSVIAFVTVPFFIFILPRITSGLHPGSADDATSGPILGGSDALNIYKQIFFSLSLGTFTMLFFWLLNLYNRYKLVKEKYD